MSNQEIYRRSQLYQSLFQDYCADVEWLEKRFLAHFPQIGQDGQIALDELACGDGRILGRLQSLLSRAGFGNILARGYDIEENMLLKGRQTWPDCEFILQDILKMRSVTSDFMILVANSLSHFHERKDRDYIYRLMKKSLRSGGMAVVAVMLEKAYSASLDASLEIGNCSDENGEQYDVYEQSRRLSGGPGPQRNGLYEIDWYFVSASGNDDFTNSFILKSWQPGELESELRAAGLAPSRIHRGFLPEEDDWEICIYTAE